VASAFNLSIVYELEPEYTQTIKPSSASFFSQVPTPFQLLQNPSVILLHPSAVISHPDGGFVGVSAVSASVGGSVVVASDATDRDLGREFIEADVSVVLIVRSQESLNARNGGREGG
jgi:hypothetical protein